MAISAIIHTIDARNSKWRHTGYVETSLTLNIGFVVIDLKFDTIMAHRSNNKSYIGLNVVNSEVDFTYIFHRSCVYYDAR